ncbi:HIT domain-containing protein [Nitriliruptoraceae bacterium ZYF776]|nr:HIT domain-containing protein [Profundirhabdus halotolerans]
MPSDCLFCRIVAGDDPAEIVAREDGVVAFRDIFPRAPVHVLVVPEEHLDSAHDLTADHTPLLGRLFQVAREVAEAEGTADGYRIATNIGAVGGQAIPHLHLHVLGGRQLGHIDTGEPPRG